MGLLLSILVSCVGVIELVAFYTNLRRSLMVASSSETDLEGIACNCRRMLTKEYRLILAEVNGEDVQPKSKTNFQLCTSPKAIFHSSLPSTNVFDFSVDGASKEDANIAQAEILGESHGQLEHKLECKSHPNPTNFEPDWIGAPNCPIREKNYILIDDTKVTPLSRRKVGKSSPSGTKADTPLHAAIDEAFADIERIYLQEESVADFFSERRSPSPFPTYELLAPRSSICTELLDDPIIINEVEEEDFISNLHDELEIERNVKSLYGSGRLSPVSNGGNRRSLSPNWCYKLEMHCERRNKSPSPSLRSSEEDFRLQPSPSIVDDIPSTNLVDRNCLQRSSPTPKSNNEEVSERVVVIQEVFDENFKNSLDGVKRTNEDRKGDFKRKRNKKGGSNSNLSRNQYYPSDHDTVDNITLKESLLERGLSTKEDVSFCSNFLIDRNVVCEKTPPFRNDDPLSTFPSTSASGHSKNVAEDDTRKITDPKPGPSKQGSNSEPFWVN